MTRLRPFPSTEILGVRVDRVDLSGLLAYLQETAKGDGRVSVFYLNPHVWNLARAAPDFKAALDAADVVWCDGIGILLASWLLGDRLPARMTVPDFLDDVCRQCVKNGRTLYFLGGEEGLAQKARGTICRRHPGLQVVGAHHGFLATREEERRLIEEIRRLAPDLLLVGMGSPQQELWIMRNLAVLNVRIGWAVGALFDILGGKVPRAPAWAGRCGLEWLHRLLVEPRRLWQRYLIGNARFLIAVVAARLFGSK